MSGQDNLKISAQLTMGSALAEVSGLTLIAGGSRQCVPTAPGLIEGHQFRVCSLEQALSVQVSVRGGEPGHVLLLLRPPAKSPTERRPALALTRHAGVWVWRSAKAPTPGAWWLELCWAGEISATRPLLWGYQVWGQSSLRARMEVPQRVATGAGVMGKVLLSGPARALRDVESSLTTPPAAPDATVARLYEAVPRLRAELAQGRSANWPGDPGRPWWRLRRVDKMAALVAAGVSDPRSLLRTPKRLEREVKLTELAAAAGYDVKVSGQYMTAAGTYALQVRVKGHVGADPEDRFERVLSRQVLAAPVPDPAASVARSWSRTIDGKVQRGFDLALWDAHGNPVLVDMSASATLGPKLRRMQRDDGKMAWIVDAADLANVSAELTWGGRTFAGAIDVPLIDGRGFEGIVREGPGRLGAEFVAVALDPRAVGKQVGLQRQEALVVQPPVGRTARFVAVFVESSGAYAVDVLRKGGKTEAVTIARGSRRYRVDLQLDEAVRLRPVDAPGSDAELPISGIRFE